MLPEIEKLLVLQDRDQRIAALKNELKNVPIERKALEERLKEAASGADKAKAGVQALEVEKRRLETEAETKRGQIAKFKTQQMQTRKNEEFQAFGQQIKHFEAEISKLEDRELEIMEEMDAAKPALAKASQAAAEAKQAVAGHIADLEAKVSALKKQLETLEAGRQPLTEGIAEEVLEEYDRLFATKGGRAVVAADHEFCTGCHMKLTTQTLVKAKGEHEIAICEECGRMLYLER